jgi:dTDP-4-dehydrorhamnose reductase
METIHNGKRVKASENTFISYSYLPELINGAIDLLIDGVSGVCHLVHPEKITMFDFAGELCKHSGMPLDMVMPSNKAVVGAPLLNAERFRMMPSLYCSIEEFVKNSGFVSGSRAKALIKTR